MAQKEKFYITVTSGMRGWFAVKIVIDETGYEEPYITGFSSHKKREGAVKDGKAWALAEQLEFKE